MPSMPRTCPSTRRRRLISWSLLAVYPRVVVGASAMGVSIPPGGKEPDAARSWRSLGRGRASVGALGGWGPRVPPPRQPIFDGHHDALTRPDAGRLVAGRDGGHLDL